MRRQDTRFFAAASRDPVKFTQWQPALTPPAPATPLNLT
jgi:hypothetical protein